MKLNVKRTILVGFAFLSICLFWQMYDNEIPLILENTFGLSATLIGVIMALDNVLAVFMLPLFGTLSDKIETNKGKRMPFIMVGTIAAAILILLLALANQLKSLPMFVTVLLLLLVAMGSYRSPAVALMPDVTPKPLRSRANAIINLMGAVGGMIALVLISVLVAKEAQPTYFPLFGTIAAVMLVSMFVVYKTIPENKLRAERVKIERQNSQDEEAGEEEQSGPMAPEVKRSLFFILAAVVCWFFGYNAITTAFSRFYQNFWGLADRGYSRCLLVGTAVAIISYIPAGWLAGKIGRKKTILVGVGILGLSYLTACFFHEYTFGINFIFAFVGAGWATINVNSYPMVVEMAKGSDIGKFTGFYYTASMSAQIVTPIVSGFLIDKLGYETLFPYAVIFTVLAFVFMWQVKHGDSRPLPPKTTLENFDVPGDD